MNPELLTCRRLTAGLVYPPINLEPVIVNRLYAVISERYPYQTLTHLPDGARMANPQNDCFIQLTRIQVNEEIVHFQTAKETALDIFETIQKHLAIPQFLTFGVKLTAFASLDGPGAAVDFVEKGLFGGQSETLDILGDGRQGTGLRIVLHRDGAYELKIEPFFNDTSQLYVELDVQHPSPFSGLEGLEVKFDGAYNYLFGEVREYLAKFN
ncbi:MAG: hypothetical protein Q7N50_06805 [Armatimonadota bacterium]|nr:hypothetical protein [Armatimonadota bacterium]